MDKETNRTAKKFAEKIRKKIPAEKIVLFGSRARGDHFLTSDYDFLIVSKAFEGIRFDKRMAEMLKYWNEKNDLEPLCYTPEEFKEKQKFGIVKTAIKEGITL